MTAYALIVGWLLTSQVNADGRYQFQSPAQTGAASAQGAPNTPGNSPGGASGATTSPFGAGAASKAGENSRGDTTPNGSDTGPNRGSAPANMPPPRTLLQLDGSPINDASPSRSPPPAYDVSPAQSIGAATQPNVGLSSSGMMRAMLAPQAGSKLGGQSVTLVDIIAGARTRAEQTQRVEAYWDLCSSVADYYLGLREQDELRRNLQGSGRAWDQFELEMRNRTGTAQRAALASQLRLASLMGRGSDYLPLPADAPHCASYHTHYQQIFAAGGPQEAKELNDLLPLRYNELKGAAASVVESEQYLNSFATTRSNDVEGGLHALNLLALRRRAFVQIARDYNRRIARYAELASPGPLTAERLSGMLIKSSVATATKSAAPAPSLNRQTNRKAPPSTFVEGASPPKRDDAVRPASGVETSATDRSSPRREHSLLVKPPE